MTVQTRYRTATDSDLQRIKRFVKDNGLPELGVDQWVRNFVIAETQDGFLIGVAGLEIYGKSGLLRSVAVDKRHRRQGLGRGLVECIVENAKGRGIASLYLLTEDASAYFKRLGFEIVDRGGIDEAVKASVEFTQICKSATAMHRAIIRNA